MANRIFASGTANMAVLASHTPAGALATIALSYYALAVPCVVGSRMLLNLREVVESDNVSFGGTVPGGAGGGRDSRTMELSEIVFN